jgi:putative oxidoreductase
VIGVLELVGGALLVAGVFTRVAAVALAGDMVGAIVTSGILQGESISLTLAPAMLVAMVVLAVLGGGPLSLERRRASPRDAGAGSVTSPRPNP